MTSSAGGTVLAKLLALDGQGIAENHTISGCLVRGPASGKNRGMPTHIMAHELPNFGWSNNSRAKRLGAFNIQSIGRFPLAIAMSLALYLMPIGRQWNLHATERQPDEVRCLALTVYWEARAQGRAGDGGRWVGGLESNEESKLPGHSL